MNSRLAAACSKCFLRLTSKFGKVFQGDRASLYLFEPLLSFALHVAGKRLTANCRNRPRCHKSYVDTAALSHGQPARQLPLPRWHRGAITWAPTMDQMPSLAIGAVAVDPTDSSENTIWAGTGNFSINDPSGDAVSHDRSEFGGLRFAEAMDITGRLPTSAVF
jgi:hypothetical protein